MKLNVPHVAILVTFLAPALAAGAIDFSYWHTPAQIGTEMANLVAAHASRAVLVPVGTTGEGRAITALKISDNVATDESDEGDVVFVGVHHAREWISAEMSLYLAEYLLNVYASGSDPELISCMNNLEIWIIPALNMDGYAYSTTSGNRFWRKNRRNNLDGTFGVDLNRNYSYQWGLGSGIEGSAFSGDDTYQGPSAFSEPETTAFRDFVLALDDPRALLTFHSYSQLVLRPWSYTSSNPPGYRTLKYIVDDSIARIAAVHGLTYGDSIWYNSFGEAGDYFWGEMRLASFTIEERPASLGAGGFDPPPSQIIPNAEENLPAALALIRDAGCRKLWIKDYSGDTGIEPSAVWTGSGWTHAFWESPDIWTTPTELVEGAAVTLHVRVHNATTGNLNGAKVVAWVTDPRLTLEFPATTSTLIGEQTVSVPAGDTTYTFPWTVPTGTNSWGEWHWCVGAGVYHPNDRPLTTQVQRTSNIGCRNFNTTPAPLMAALGRQPFIMTVENFLDVAAEYRVEIELPARGKGWNVRLPAGEATTLPAARLLGVTRNVLAPGESRCVPVRIDIPQDLERGSTHEIRLHTALIPLVPGKRIPVGNGYTIQIRVPKR